MVEKKCFAVFCPNCQIFGCTPRLKYLGYILSNNSDNAEMLRQMKLLYCRSNRLIRLFSKCSKTVFIELCRNFCTTFYCPYFWAHNKKLQFQSFVLHIRTYIGKY